MEARAKLLGHAVHQMLIPYPLGLLTTAIVFDLIHLSTGNPQWSIAYWMIAVGIVGGLAAAVFGFIDFLSIPLHTRAKRLGALHGIGNVVMVSLFAVSWLMRRPNPQHPSAMAFWFAVRRERQRSELAERSVSEGCGGWRRVLTAVSSLT